MTNSSQPVSNSLTVTVEHVLRPHRNYADTEYEAYLTFSVPEGQAWASKFGSTPEVAKQYAQLMVHHFVEPTPERPREWHEPWLEKLTQVSPCRWHVIVRSPYLD